MTIDLQRAFTTLVVPNIAQTIPYIDLDIPTFYWQYALGNLSIPNLGPRLCVPGFRLDCLYRMVSSSLVGSLVLSVWKAAIFVNPPITDWS